MKPKKKLNIEVKTLEAKIAPGSCRRIHNELYANHMPAADATWNDYSSKQTSNNVGNNPGNDKIMPPAGVPIIGIN